MDTKIDKRVRAQQFRERLNRALGERGMSQSALARQTGVDRSTISQLLTDDGARLPNAHVVGSCASALGVSADWLLSLSNRPESAAELLASSMSVTEAPRALVDERIFEWHREAAGYKIRHVPAALPDLLKTRALLEWEYAPHLGRTADQAIGASEDRLSLMRQAQSDYEIAMPLYELESFANACGYYEGLPLDIRLEQLDHFERLCTQLYPRLRIYLFDAKRLFASPVTIFGPLLCVFYAGSHYMAFRDRERIETFTNHFDQLIREADLTARQLPERLRAWKTGIRD
ncbi:helix-turn-helix domain-containing protein [Phaeobacter gallaeciensis]|uniref:helix-turn-helix domain-containing protein n=1 Tax=Phaeobacter gallaeciensis TaxID=60890 RepID=UPI00237F2194|nr:helix-turn-helix transcriptional regulator [Phaeobacter gallaeciensis]MDE4191577.1 helix-turn-helix transcriptional regulator [Phaeobacter gallaeciensis]MDE4200040.1 helix-turn-helix transcriptional regulator [Phaeobacter gallaeciensis]MDE4204191.1 helix-turn-helix transcriptional regulator [Phaeobacter gallaeciensis]MDE4208332.1 helix-turn-helix transcriptional regulator [Phaeobacter gallaeciensis]MDE4216418.1 helix-turn-helix transcriptional regulator [Phaeobacter gallaeciensis]